MIDMTDDNQQIIINYGFFKSLQVYREIWKWIEDKKAKIEFITYDVGDGRTQDRIQMSVYKNDELIYVNSIKSIIEVWQQIKEKYETA